MNREQYIRDRSVTSNDIKRKFIDILKLNHVSDIIIDDINSDYWNVYGLGEVIRKSLSGYKVQLYFKLAIIYLKDESYITISDSDCSLPKYKLYRRDPFDFDVECDCNNIDIIRDNRICWRLVCTNNGFVSETTGNEIMIKKIDNNPKYYVITSNHSNVLMISENTKTKIDQLRLVIKS